MAQAEDRSLTDVTTAMAEAGWTGSFVALEGGQLRCSTCHEVQPASIIDHEGATRVEGASDPADMAIVMPATCGSCGTKGTVVAQFGPEASAADADLVAATPRRPSVPAEQEER